MESQNQQPSQWQPGQPTQQPQPQPPPPPSVQPSAPPTPKRSMALPIGILAIVIIIAGAALYLYGTPAPKQQNTASQHASAPPQSSAANTPAQTSTPPSNSTPQSPQATSNSSTHSSPPEYLPGPEAEQILGQHGNYSTVLVTNQTEIDLYLSGIGYHATPTVNAIYITYLNSTSNASVKLRVFKIASPDSGQMYADFLNSTYYGGGAEATYMGMSYTISSIARIAAVVGHGGDSFIEAYVLGNPSLNQTMLLSILANYTGAHSTGATPAQNLTFSACTSLNISVTTPNTSSGGECAWAGGNLTLVSNIAPSSYGSYTVLNASGRLITFSTVPINKLNNSSSSCASADSMGDLPAGNYIVRLSLQKVNESCGANYIMLKSG